jgi:hypothetical protein
MASITRAWSRAEQQILLRLATITGLTRGETLFVGHKIDLKLRVNLAVFAIIGGGEQRQGMQSGTNVWHVTGRLCASFHDRDKIQNLASLLLLRRNIPFEGGLSPLENVIKFYVRTHPTLDRVEKVLAGGQTILSTELEMDFGVVYQSTAEDEQVSE